MFVHLCYDNVLKKFLMYQQDLSFHEKRLLLFLFYEDEAISAHTCGRVVYFPKKAFVRIKHSLIFILYFYITYHAR